MAIQISGSTVIHDSQDVQVSGVVTATSFHGDASQLTNLPAAGSSLEATASGTLSDGSTVIVNADGTVSVVAKSETTGAGVYSASKTVFESGEPYYTQSAFVGSGKIVIVYRDQGNSYYGTAVVGTVSGTSISFGTPVVFNTANTTDLSVTYDSANDKVVVVYCDRGNSNYGTALVGEVSGTSISFPSSPVVFESATTYYTATTFDSTNGKVVIAYMDQGNSMYGTAIVGTVSGTSISFPSSPVIFEYATTHHTSATFDSTNNKVVVAYSDNGNSNYGTAVVGTVSGTSISFGSPVVWSSTGATATAKSVVYDSSSQKVVIVYRDDDGSLYYTRAIVGTVSGTSISFGTAVVVSATNSTEIRAVYDSTNNKVVVTYLNGSGLFAVLGTVSGTTISFGSAVEIESVYSTYGFPAYDSTNDKVVVAYGDSASSNRGTAIVLATNGPLTQLGSASIFETAAMDELSIVYDSSSNRMVVAYRDDGNSGYGTAVVGTVSGTGITFGTPEVFNSGSTYYTSMAFDSTNNKVVICYADYGAGGAGKAIVGTVDTTDNSIDFGAEATITNSNINVNTTVYDPDSEGGKILVFYRNNDSSGHGMGQIGTVSGTSISFASAVTFESAPVDGVDAVYTTGGKTVIVYQDDGNSDYGTAVVATINPSGGALTFGTPVPFHSGAISNRSSRITYDSDNDKVVIIYINQEGGSWADGYGVVGTVSGTLSSATVSFGTPAVFESINAYTGNSDIIYDSDSQKIVIAYRYQSSPENGKIVVGSVSGTSISFESSTIFRESGTINSPGLGYDSTNKKVVVAYRDIGNSSYGTAKVFSPITKATNLTAENFIGVSDGAYSNGQTATIQLIGSVDDAQSGLTPGQKYYVQGDGTLSTTADSPSLLAGKAISSTNLVIKG